METFEIINLNLFYEDNHALKDINLSIPKKKSLHLLVLHDVENLHS